MSMKAMFKNDETLERNGVLVDYGPFRVTLARAGGSNKKFERLMEAKVRPYKRAIQTETMDTEKTKEIMREIYADTVILNWEVKVEEDVYTQGIEDLNDETKTVPFNRENVIKTLKALPELFQDLITQAGNASLFREEIRETDAKN